MPNRLANDPNYKLVFQHEGFAFYQPVNTAEGYHQSRYVEACNQHIYANAGATVEVIQTICNEMITRCNKEFKTDTLRTDLALLANNLLYRTKYPVDQHCAIRLGALLCFMETDQATEDPNKVSLHWQQKKETLAYEIPEVYAFFLSMGIINIPKYSEVWNTLNGEAYFLDRDQQLNSLLPNAKKEQQKTAAE
jgi:hypothetical protein